MRGRERLALLSTLVLLSSFLVILTQSVLRRAHATFDYPDYSSLNNSDKGLKAYHDALERLGYRVARNFQPLPKLAGSHATVLYAGPSLQAFRDVDKADLKIFEQLARAGSKVVLLLSSESSMLNPAAVDLSARKLGKQKSPPGSTLKDRWGVQIDFQNFVNPGAHGPVKTVRSRIVSWTGEWHASRFEFGFPLFLERQFGRGSVLLAGNLEAFTNRQLLTNPEGEMLAAIPVGLNAIVFDESHLGVADTGTVAGLARAHHLQWLVLGFVVLAALYIWRSTVSFVSPPAISSEQTVAGADAYRALSNLLTQSISPKDILTAVAKEWNASNTVRGPLARDIGEADFSRLKNIPHGDVAREYNRLAKQAGRGPLH